MKMPPDKDNFGCKLCGKGFYFINQWVAHGLNVFFNCLISGPRTNLAWGINYKIEVTMDGL